MTLARIIGFRLVAGDARRLVGFYEAIGFRVDAPRPIDADELAVLGIAGGGWRWPMRLGAGRVDLDQFAVRGRPISTEPTIRRDFQHLAIVTTDIDAAWRRATAAGAVPVSRAGPVTLPPASGGVTAVKFRDPEGHPLEFLQFPDARAHRAPGIDHSAIVTGDVGASAAFYRGRGLATGDETCNRGAEQASLDGVDDPRVSVVPMMPETRAPHVELLGYHVPPPADATWTPVDLVATRIVWQGAAPALLRDPDGHLHQIVG